MKNLFHLLKSLFPLGTNSSIITKQLRMINTKGEEYLILGDENAKFSFKDVTLTGIKI